MSNDKNIEKIGCNWRQLDEMFYDFMYTTKGLSQ